jgi:2-methylcitrate dehydratase PrpD
MGYVLDAETLSQRLAEFVEEIKLNSLPTEVISKIKLHLLDTLGIMIAMYSNELAAKAVEVAKRLGGRPESTIVGYGIRTGAASAALANAVMAHAADYDDTHLGSLAHLGCVSVPAALAVGESVGAYGDTVIEALVAHYEITSRIGLASPGILHLRGFHPTSVIGVFGAAAASGKLLGLSKEKIRDALGIAGSMASGILQGLKEGREVKPLHPAIAAHNGVLAAYMAYAGLEGPSEVFEGEWGFFRAYMGWDKRGEDVNLDMIVKDLGRRWELMNTSTKPYPSCHASHSSIDLAISMRNKYSIEVNEVEEILIHVPRVAIELICEPWEHKITPRTPYEAKFSAPYLVVVALRRGWVGLRDFTKESIEDPEVLKHTKKIRCVVDQSLWLSRNPYVIPARMIIKTKDGKTYEEEIVEHKGTPGNPMTIEDVIKKFVNNITATKYERSSEDLVKAIMTIEKQEVAEIMRMLA